MILAFDFDGVICDSASETAMSGWEAATDIWPDDFNIKINKESIEAFRSCRPVLETGYHSILIMKLLKDGYSTKQIMNNFNSLIDELMQKEVLDRTALIKKFGNKRDSWIQNNFDSWLHAHSFFPGLVNKINSLIADYDVFIITTKEKRFATALIEYAGLNISEARIYGLESGKKSLVLKQLSKIYPSQTIHFFEDRLKTIINLNEDYLQNYLVDWGYNLDDQHKQASLSPSIELISLAEFYDFAP